MTIIRQGHGYLTNNYEYQHTNIENKKNTYLCQIKDTVHSCIRIHIVSMLNFNNIAHLKLPTGWLLLLIPPLISTLWQYFVCKQGHRIFNGSVWFSKTEFFYFLKYSLQIYLDVYFQEIQNLKHSMYKLFVIKTLILNMLDSKEILYQVK